MLDTRVEISFRSIINTILVIVGIYFAYLVRELFYSLFLAYIFMSALKPTVNLLETKWGVKRKLVCILTVGLVLAIFGYIASFVLPPILHETVLFLGGLPALLSAVAPNLANSIDGSSFASILPNITTNLVNIVGGIFSNLFFVVSVIFFTLYFLMDPNFIENSIKIFFPPERVAVVVRVANNIESRIGSWVTGELILMTAIGVASYIGLTLLGVRYALSLAFLAGILEVVPMIGPIISAVPAILVAATGGWVTVGLVLGLYTIIQQLENNFLVPYVMSKTVGLSPLLTLIALSIGGKIGGVMGVILAVPVTLCVEAILHEFFPASKKKK